jgi:hypothetical protein
MLKFGRKQQKARPQDERHTGSREEFWCTCDARLVVCSRCGQAYCPQCDMPHTIRVDARSAPVAVCPRW